MERPSAGRLESGAVVGVEPVAMTETQKVARAAAKAAHWRAELEAAIRDARAAGVPLRTIAEAANLSHEHVRRIANEPERWAFGVKPKESK